MNSTELRDQWTNVWGISQTAVVDVHPDRWTTLNVYNDAAGKPAVELYTISGMGHGTAVHPVRAIDQCGTTGTYYPNYICSTYYTAKFWGLDQAGGGGGGGTLPAPTGLAVGSTTSNSVTLSWSSVSGAAGYRVYRDGALESSPTSTTATDTGLVAGTTYAYMVAAVDSGGVEGARSAPVSATTSGTVAACFTDNNYNQTVAGRAHMSGGYVYANGSNQAMGLWNVFTVHTLRQTAANYFVLADSGC